MSDFDIEEYHRRELERWINRRPPVLELKPVPEMEAYPDLPYDFSQCPVIFYPYNGNSLYMISERNQPEASRVILGLNDLLKQAREDNPEFPDTRLTEKHLRFYPSEDPGLEGDDYSYFRLNPRTKTGKLTKYPLSIWVQTLSYDDSYKASLSDKIPRVHGEITYLADGRIGKIDLYCWLGSRLFPIKWKL